MLIDLKRAGPPAPNRNGRRPIPTVRSSLGGGRLLCWRVSTSRIGHTHDLAYLLARPIDQFSDGLDVRSCSSTVAPSRDATRDRPGQRLGRSKGRQCSFTGSTHLPRLGYRQTWLGSGPRSLGGSSIVILEVQRVDGQAQPGWRDRCRKLAAVKSGPTDGVSHVKTVQIAERNELLDARVGTRLQLGKAQSADPRHLEDSGAADPCLEPRDRKATSERGPQPPAMGAGG